MSFIHLHNHSHYSMLDGAAKIPDMIKKAVELNMPGVAITDHGNMFGAVEFYKACKKAGIKPVIGIEAYITDADLHEKKKGLGKRDKAHVILLAKNMEGLENLFYLSSIAYTEGFYHKPRIDHELLRGHSSGIIASSACLNGEIALAFRDGNREEAIRKAEWYLETFGDDYYLEIQDHGIPGEKEIYDQIYKLGKELRIPVIATNDNHYLDKEHWESHDILLCLQTGKEYDDPNRMRYNTTELYFKSADEMFKVFQDRPEVLERTMEIFEKIDLEIPLGRRLLLPEFPVPITEGNISLDDYLRKVGEEGLKKRYSAINEEIKERFNYELGVISKMGFAGYFLIVMDFINAARERKIPVGLGRGSAAGSIVAYSLGITSIDPLKYGLLFERFLNPERVSMPDIDIDFCMERRSEVIDYVKEKYGHDNVAQIITFGTMAPKNSLKDVARILKISFEESNKLSQLIPVSQGKAMPLRQAFEEIPELKLIKESDDPTYKSLYKHSTVLEGLVRQPGIHAAGVIIAPDDIKKYVPLYKNSDGEVTTQFSMKYLEEMGLLKMDFLGLRTLTVIDKTIKMIYQNYGIKVDPLNIPLDDKKTYTLFAKARTTGVFQFESQGMKEYLKKLKPTEIPDLIAMNALYRPGPMQFIDSFINRKHGKEKVYYEHPLLEPILKETYGIIIYQEQVMSVAHQLAGFTLGEADLMRRAMGKKDKTLMAEMREKFIKGCENNNIPKNKASEIFDMIEKFAQYGFNKSHSAAYAVIAYQTAYLKANYPAEFMSAIMTSEINSTDRIQQYMEEAKQMGIKVLPPDINHSYKEFAPISKDSISFGLEAIKNVGSKPIEIIVRIREEEGKYKNIFDLVQKVDLRLVNRKVLEALIQSGALDSLEGNRAQNFAAIDTALEFGNRMQAYRGNKHQTSLFGGENESMAESLISYPELPDVPLWDKTEMLKREFELLGFYLTGHPLQDYQKELEDYGNIDSLSLKEARDGQNARAGGLISSVKTIITKNGKEMAFVSIEDFAGHFEVIVFSDNFPKLKNQLIQGRAVFVLGTVSGRGGTNKLVANDMFPLKDTTSKLSGGLKLNIVLNEFSKDRLKQLKNILEVNHRENGVPVYVNAETERYGVYLKVNKYRVIPGSRLLRDLGTVVGKEKIAIIPAKNIGKYN